MITESVSDPSVCKRAFIETLKRLTIPEVKILRLAASGPLRFDVFEASSSAIELQEHIVNATFELFGVHDKRELEASLSLLAVNGCIVVKTQSIVRDIKADNNDIFASRVGTVTQERYKLWLTRFGAELIKALCSDAIILPQAVKQPWSLTDQAIEMASDAGMAASNTISVEGIQEMIDTSIPDLRFQ